MSDEGIGEILAESGGLDEIFSFDEIKQLIMAIVKPRKAEGVTCSEIGRCLRWAKEAKIDAALLELVMEERAQVSWPEGAEEPCFHMVEVVG